MILIVAGRYDKVARALVARWADRGASLLTCEDLSVAGWRYYSDAPQSSTIIVGGLALAAKEVDGVLTRLPCVFDHELVHIVPADRAYVAAEMTAFLMSWLSGLECPVLNRPTPGCLSGPNWRPEQWVHLATQVGIPVRPVPRHVTLSASGAPEAPDPYPVSVTVVGDRCIGQVANSLTAQARRLADAAGVGLLAVRFSGSEPGAAFVGADLWPEIATDGVADAVLDYLQRSS